MLDTLKTTGNFINVIRKAENANENELKLARKDLMRIVKTIGAKNFVAMAAEVLKNNFRIAGCNDIRMPLKRIFAIPLEELEEELSKQRYNLSEGHPLVMLSQDHKENIKKLKALRISLGGLNLNKETTKEAIKNKLKQVQDYYAELESHIRKEEEVFFPALEENGMQEHPQNLREEHKGFREILSKIIEMFKGFTPEKIDSIIEEVRKSKEKFIIDISNHIFRETFIFYPAALEFITEPDLWEKIKKDFQGLGK